MAVAGRTADDQVIPTPPVRPTALDPAMELTWRGIDAMYSYRFHEAAEALDSAIALDAENVQAPFVAVANEWLRSLTEEGTTASHDALFKAIDRTLPTYKAMIKRHGRRPDLLLYLGSTYGLKARVALARKKWVTVLYTGLKGWLIIREAHEQDSTLADAYLPIGVFNYYMGISSAPIKYAARMFGARPDRKRGLAEMRRAVAQAPHAWIESASTLAVVYMYIENNPELAYQYANMLADHYPESYYFNLMKGEGLVRTRRTREARTFLPELRALFDRSHPNQRLEWDLKYALLEATSAHDDGRLEEALELCGWIIDHYDMEFDWHLGFAYHLRARVYEELGNRALARQDYRRVVKLDNKTYVVEQAKLALRRLDRKVAINNHQ